MRWNSVLVGLVTLAMGSVCVSADEPSKKQVLLIAGPPSHGFGAHEHYAGLSVLADSLKEASDTLETKLVRGWPSDASLVESADAVVIYCDGGRRHVAFDHLDDLQKLLARGGGLVCLHYAVEMLPDESGDRFVDLLGGHFQVNYSVNPHWKASFQNLPEHPVTQGVMPFATEDEWYFHLRFSEAGKVTPILQAVAPEHTMARKDGTHSGNPAVRKSVALGQPQTVAWAFEPTMGGRSFGFTGGHHHWNWAHAPVRRLVTNAIRWVAGDTVESAGSTLDTMQPGKLIADQDEPVPRNFDAKKIAEDFEVPLELLIKTDASSPNNNQSSSNARPSAGKRSQLLALTPLVDSMTSRHAIDLDVDLSKLKGDRNLYLVVTDGGNGFSCDWANWNDPELHGPAGKMDLVDLDWISATAGFGDVHKNANCVGDPITVREYTVARTGLGTHASSVIHYQIPPGYNRLTVTAALDSGGTRQQEGKHTSVRFAVFANKLPNLSSLDTMGGQSQREPAEAVAGLEVGSGLEVTLMGSEPHLKSLTNLDVDHRGRVWVCDVMNYRGRNGSRPEGDRILILEDTTGDGQLDSVKTYYQGRDIDSAMGICVLGNEVIVTASPNVWRFVDTDGDDVPDSKTALFTETGDPQHDHSAHSFLFGPDGKLYWNFGNTGKQVKDAAGQTVVDIHGRPVVDNGKPFFGGMPFRCNLDGSEFEVLAHNFRNNWETTVDSFGSLWQSDNDDDGNRGTRINFVMEHGNYGYRDERSGDSWQGDRVTLEEDIPLRHWHLNDPGVVPNVLQTGAGSPSGICVYEGRLLPQRFWDQVIHCDPGPNVVRAYPMSIHGAGYTAAIEPLVTGTLDKWFRPADVCVAPDGSLFVSDWYDPGVGGHRQEDSDRGRLFRIAPPGVKYTVPKFDFESAEGCVEALRNPNQSVRYMAWSRLHEMGASAEPALLKLYVDKNPRLRARALWLLGKIAGRGPSYVDKAIRDEDSDIRITGIRLAKQLGMSAAEACGSLATDSNAGVRRELAVALRFDESDAMPNVWAQLAVQHSVGERWYLEALGIGSDVRPNECFEAWAKINGGEWNTPPGRDIVWRVRADASAPAMVELISDSTLPLEQTNRYFRSLEYHRDEVRDAALGRLLSLK